ncbi:MAG: polymer-forming cytoskeletal protein [Nitrospira sp.]|nr:polymer-forming cytoskeletal protein [Candidatus Manganitrophaceae bacterium]HIL35786.1 polymer-forming cytoskeletal protein [Candidatus Manganitrophaceae bacterium]
MGRKENMDEIIAFLGKGTEFKGIITYTGTIRIDGKVEGEIVSEGSLVIGESADVQAEIIVETVVCSGKISGNVRASKKVHLLPKAIFDGSINTPSLVIDEGVQFNATCNMNMKNSEKEESVTALHAVGQETQG